LSRLAPETLFRPASPRPTATETAKNPLGTLKNAVLRGGSPARALKILQKSIDFFQKIYYNSYNTRYRYVGFMGNKNRAWFILQHYHGYRPFVTVMEENIKINGKANVKKL
jgi:hypothetical protein